MNKSSHNDNQFHFPIDTQFYNRTYSSIAIDEQNNQQLLFKLAHNMHPWK